MGGGFFTLFGAVRRAEQWGARFNNHSNPVVGFDSVTLFNMRIKVND
jgi:hypothetical protein